MVSTRGVNRQVSESVRIQYGGSVNDKNAAELGVLDLENGMWSDQRWKDGVG